jgi:hypothetical protein
MHAQTLPRRNDLFNETIGERSAGNSVRQPRMDADERGWDRRSAGVSAVPIDELEEATLFRTIGQ